MLADSPESIRISIGIALRMVGWQCFFDYDNDNDTHNDCIRPFQD